MNLSILHYVHDPLCGWCYAASPLVVAAVEDGFGVSLHGGGLWNRATQPTPEQRDAIHQHDQRVTALSGMRFGTAYQQKLLNDAQLVFWSRPTIGAILAAGTLRNGADLSMLQAIQTAHYVHGHRVVDTPVLVNLALGIGLPRKAFQDAIQASQADQHIEETRRWMSQFGLGGFPGFVLQCADSYVRVPHEACYGKPAAFVHTLCAITNQIH